MSKFNAYPLKSSMAPNDTLLFWEQSSETVNQLNRTSLNTIDSVPTVGSLKVIDITKIIDGASVFVQGYYAAGDGGGGIFRYASASILADNGGTVIQPTVGAGRWLRPENEVFNVMEFGATGDGATDDTAKIQATINAGTAAQGGQIIFFPPGRYKITAALVIGPRRLTLRGCGPQGSNATAIVKTGLQNVDFIDATNIVDTFSLEHIQLQGDGTPGNGNGVNLGSVATFAADCRITNCWFNQIPNACIYAVNMAGYHINNNGFEQSAYGIYFPSNVISSKANNVIENNRFFGLGSAIWGAFTNHDDIVGNHFDLCGANDDVSGAIVYSTSSTEVRGISIIGNKFHANYNDIVFLGAASKSGHTGVTVNSIIGNHSDFAQRRFLYANACDGVSVLSNYINDSGQNADATYASIELAGTTANVTISGNTTKYASANRPSYGLLTGVGTTGTNIGVNEFNGALGSINLGADCTFLTTGYEGSFTPDVSGATTAGVTTYTTRLGTFQRCGQWVHFSIRVSWSSATGTGTMRVGSLPFSSISTANLLQAVSIGYATLSYAPTTAVVAYIPSGTNYIVVNSYAAGVSTEINVNASGDLIISGSYRL